MSEIRSLSDSPGFVDEAFLTKKRDFVNVPEEFLKQGERQWGCLVNLEI